MRNIKKIALCLLLLFALPAPCLAAQPVVLTGSALTLEQIEAVARGNAAITLDAAAMKRVEASHRLLLQAAREGKNVYGLNTGVGINKDRVVFSGDVLAKEAREASENFNNHLLITHAVSIGPRAPRDVVRATMLIRLNQALTGYAAFHPDIVTMYAALLNKGVHPVLPMQGTVGMADITVLPYIGLVMSGQHQAEVNGTILPGGQALQNAGIKAIKPYAKDGLALVSSNAFSAGLAALACLDAQKVLRTADTVVALSLEGLNGNIAPFLAETQKLRPFAGPMESAANIRTDLQGSYLYMEHPNRPMQDPLSFRDSAMTHGTALDALENLKKNLLIHINHQDDNPAVMVNGVFDDAANAFLAKRYSINPGKDAKSPNGLVLANANFDPLIWVTDLERLSIAFSHISRASAQRILKLAANRFTNLPRNLAPDNANIGYLTIQKTASLLDAEIRTLSMPVSVDVLPLSGEIEDMGTNAALVIERINGQMDRLYALFAIETLHSTRAFGLRKRDDAAVTLGKGTQKLFDVVNRIVPAVSDDRIQGPDIENVAAALAEK